MRAPLVTFRRGPGGRVRGECRICGWCEGPCGSLASDALLEHVWRCTGLPGELWEWPRADRASGF